MNFRCRNLKKKVDERNYQNLNYAYSESFVKLQYSGTEAIINSTISTSLDETSFPAVTNEFGCTAQCTQLPPSLPTIPQQCTHAVLF